jgi:S1-C subfamily serine protease
MPTDQPATSTFSDDDDDKVFAERMARYDQWDHFDYPENKIGRELNVMGGGTFDAAMTALSKDHLAGTAVEAAGSFAAGFAIRAAEAKLPILRPAIAIVGAALTVSFVQDLLGKGSEVGGILADTWTHPDHTDKNRAAFAQHGGKFAFDLALTSGAALGGSALGNRWMFGPASNFTRIATYDGLAFRGKKTMPHARLYSKDDPVAMLFEETRPSSLKFKAQVFKGAKASTTYSGNAFLISEDGLAVTNWHCVKEKDTLTAIDHMGVNHKATVLAADIPNDVAILQLEKGSTESIFKPLKLAADDIAPGGKVMVVSHQSKVPELTLSSGRVKDIKTIPVFPDAPKNLTPKVDIVLHPFSRELVVTAPATAGPAVDTDRLMVSYFSKPGVSGSPVINGAGEVVGVHQGSLGKWFSQQTSRNEAVPMSAISKVLQEALIKRGQGISP